MYKYEEVYKETLKYFCGDELATTVWIDKYCLTDSDNNYLELTPDNMFRRLAKEFARIESNYKNPLSEEKIYSKLKDFSIIPGGSVLYGVGNKYSITSLGNCFVIGNTADSIGGIMETLEEQAQLMKRRGGVGHDLSHVRPNKSKVTNSAGTSSGIVPFMELYSQTTRTIGQDGRRGALMLSLNVSHPDIWQFLLVKEDLTKVTGANISIKIDDKFMECVKNNTDYRLFYITPEHKDDIQIFIKAKELWDKIIHQAWKNAEPGVLFWDRVLESSPADCYKVFQSVSTNPCGEIPLSPYDSCRLLSINLYNYIDNPFTKKASFNWGRYRDDIHIAQRLMDDIVDLEAEKIDLILDKIQKDTESWEFKSKEADMWIKIKQSLLDGRRTGLSAIGLGDALVALGLQYGTKKATEVAESIYKNLAVSAYSESINLARERGAFPAHDIRKEIDHPYLNKIATSINSIYHDICKDGIQFNEKWVEYGRRNIACLTIPPSGSISMLAQITSGIEPVFDIYYKRRRKVDAEHPNKSYQDDTGDWWEEFTVFHHKFIEWYSIVSGLNNYEESLKYLQNSTLEMLDKLIEDSPYKDAISSKIDYLEKVNMQGKIQGWIDHSISVTHNLPEDITEEEVSKIYFKAWEVGCKGVTVYRKGSRSGVLIKDEGEFNPISAIKRGKELVGEFHNMTSKGKTYGVVVGLLEGKPYEIFAFEDPEYKDSIKGKIIKIKKGHYSFTSEKYTVDELTLPLESKEERAHTIYTSGLLRHRTPLKYVIKTIKKTDGELSSFSSVLRRTLSKYVKDGEHIVEKCSECGNTELRYEGGCLICPSCGMSLCS